jgi:hypothetical protein
MFLVIFVTFLCILLTENFVEKYYHIFLHYLLISCEKSYENCLIPSQALDDCLWYMLLEVCEFIVTVCI